MKFKIVASNKKPCNRGMSATKFLPHNKRKRGKWTQKNLSFALSLVLVPVWFRQRVQL